jgi:hypothetical protein
MLTFEFLGPNAEQNDVSDVVAHVADRAAAEIDEGHEFGAALALQGRIVAANRVCSVLLRIALVELETVLGSDLFAEPFYLGFMVEHRRFPSGWFHLPWPFIRRGTCRGAVRTHLARQEFHNQRRMRRPAVTLPMASTIFKLQSSSSVVGGA